MTYDLDEMQNNNSGKEKQPIEVKNIVYSVILFLIGLLSLTVGYILGALIFWFIALCVFINSVIPKNKNNNSDQKEQIAEQNFLINCPCCGRQVSNKAPSCPNCGQPINQTGNQENLKRIFCPRCKGTNVVVNLENVVGSYGGRSEVRKKSVVTNTANRVGRAGMTIMTGGLWLLTPKKSKYNEVKKGKVYTQQIKTAVCQDCGKSWRI